jgi:hypothetical protein
MARSKSQKQQQQQQPQQEQQQTGGGATEYGAATYGEPSQQHADPQFGNVIATKSQPAAAGGKSQLSKQQLQQTILKQLKQLKQSGGSSLAFSDYSASAAAPAGPASQVGASGAPESFSLSSLPSLSSAMSGSESGPAMPPVPPSVAANINVPLKVVDSGADVSAGPKVGGTGHDMFSLDKLAAGFKQSGGRLSKQQLGIFSQQLDKLQQKQQGGVGLNEIIVPLILLYATQRYSQGKTFKSKGRTMRRTMRRSRRFRR